MNYYDYEYEETLYEGAPSYVFLRIDEQKETKFIIFDSYGSLNQWNLQPHAYKWLFLPCWDVA